MQLVQFLELIDDHLENKDIITEKIKEFFNNYFINWYNNDIVLEDEEYFKNNFTIKNIDKKIFFKLIPKLILFL